MRFSVITIFPDLISHYVNESILKRAQKKKLIKVKAIDLRDFATDKHQKVDDTPYGGGPGMVLKVEPIYRALQALALSSRAKRSGAEGSLKQCDKIKIVVLDPAGKKFDQKMAKRFSKLDNLVLICGRYEGFDERVYKFVDEKVSIGDYVLSGGELPALVVLETVARLVPGVMGNPASLDEETFNMKTKKQKNKKTLGENVDVVEYPQYTRPEKFMNMKVPKILLSGNHKKIEEWRRKLSTT